MHSNYRLLCQYLAARLGFQFRPFSDEFKKLIEEYESEEGGELDDCSIAMDEGKNSRNECHLDRG